MAQHIFAGTAAPVTTPTKIGQHFIDTVAKISYISVGTSSSADWSTTGGSGNITLPDTQILVGNASNIATGVSLTLNATGGTFALANTGVLTMPNANGSTRGLLTSADWTTFNNKGNGTVTSFSFVDANGVVGSVITASTTPELTISLTDITPNTVTATSDIVSTAGNISGINVSASVALTGIAVILGQGGATDGELILQNAANAFTTTIKTGVTGADYTLILPTTDGGAGEFLQTNGSGVLTWAAASTAPGGSNTQLQYNNSSAFGGITGATSDGTNIFIPTLYGSSAGNGDLILEGTSNATKTTSYIFMQQTGGFVSIGGVAAPTYKLDITSATAGSDLIRITSTSSGGQATYNAVNNGAVSASYGVLGSGGGYGALTANNAFLYTTNMITLMSDGNIIKFASGGNSERIRIDSAGSMGIGQTTVTAYLHIKAGTATASTAPLKFTSGTNLTTAEAGAMEYNGTNLFFTRAGTVRENVLVAVDNVAAPSTSIGATIVNFYGSSATNFLGDPNRWLSVNILGSVYKIPLYT